MKFMACLLKMDSLEILVQDRSQKLNIYVIAGIAGILPHIQDSEKK